MEAGDEAFWSQFWSDSVTNVQDVFTLIPAAEIRALREESPSNLATLCYKAVEKLVQAAESGCRTATEQQTGTVIIAVCIDSYVMIKTCLGRMKILGILQINANPTKIEANL